MPLPDGSVDVVVSGLVLNFVPDPRREVAESARVAQPGGVVAAYVWDYAEGMGMMPYFWDAAATLDPVAAELDEGHRFSIRRPEPLVRLWVDVGMDQLTVRAVDIPTDFAGFDDYWQALLGGQGPAPGYAFVPSLMSGVARSETCCWHACLPIRMGPSRSRPRAWAVQGVATG